jgi:hypothetical protein
MTCASNDFAFPSYPQWLRHYRTADPCKQAAIKAELQRVRTKGRTPDLALTSEFNALRDAATERFMAALRSIHGRMVVVLGEGDFADEAGKRLDWLAQHLAARPADRPHDGGEA